MLSVDFSPCGSAIASSGVDGTIKLWSIADAEVQSRISAAQAIADEASCARAEASAARDGALIPATQRWPAAVQFPLYSISRMHAAAARPETCAAASSIAASSLVACSMAKSSMAASTSASMSPASVVREAPRGTSAPPAASSRHLPQGLPPQPPSPQRLPDSRGRNGGSAATPWAVRDSSSIGDRQQVHGGAASGREPPPFCGGAASLAYVDLVRFVAGGRILSRGTEGCAALWEQPLHALDGSSRVGQAGQASSSWAAAAASLEPPLAYAGTEQLGAEQPAGFRAVQVSERGESCGGSSRLSSSPFPLCLLDRW